MTAILSNTGFHKACAFVESEGRALDAALLRYDLGTGAAEAVLTALSAYQNPDGGFGHGLEPDMASPASSALATSVGLRLLRRIEASSGHPMVEAALAWLDRTFDWMPASGRSSPRRWTRRPTRHGGRGRRICPRAGMASGSIPAPSCLAISTLGGLMRRRRF